MTMNEKEKATLEKVRIEEIIEAMETELIVLKEERRKVQLHLARLNKIEKQRDARKSKNQESHEVWQEKHKDFGKTKPPDWL